MVFQISASQMNNNQYDLKKQKLSLHSSKYWAVKWKGWNITLNGIKNYDWSIKNVYDFFSWNEQIQLNCSVRIIIT
jgi:hypothetical protein